MEIFAHHVQAQDVCFMVVLSCFTSTPTAMFKLIITVTENAAEMFGFMILKLLW